MVTGRYDESRSPEALNARPFLRARPAPVLTISRGARSPAADPKLADAASSPNLDDPPAPRHPPATSTATAVSADADRPDPASSVPPRAVRVGDEDADVRTTITSAGGDGRHRGDVDLPKAGDVDDTQPMNRDTEEGR
jgi:hypothetical protein